MQHLLNVKKHHNQSKHHNFQPTLSATPPGLSPVISTLSGADLISRSRPKDSVSPRWSTIVSMVQTPASSLDSPFLQCSILQGGRVLFCVTWTGVAGSKGGSSPLAFCGGLGHSMLIMLLTRVTALCSSLGERLTSSPSRWGSFLMPRFVPPAASTQRMGMKGDSAPGGPLGPSSDSSELP